MRIGNLTVDLKKIKGTVCFMICSFRLSDVWKSVAAKNTKKVDLNLYHLNFVVLTCIICSYLI